MKKTPASYVTAAITALVLMSANIAAAATLAGPIGLSDSSADSVRGGETATYEDATILAQTSVTEAAPSANIIDDTTTAQDNPGQLASVMAALSAGDVGTWIWVLLLLLLLVVAVTYAYNYSRYSSIEEFDRSRY